MTTAYDALISALVVLVLLSGCVAWVGMILLGVTKRRPW